MGRKAFESTVKEVTEQYKQWGVDRPEEQARSQVAPRAARVDAARAWQPTPEPLDPSRIAPVEKSVRFPLDDENSWSVDRHLGLSSPRTAFHSRPNRKAMREYHDAAMRKLRERLGG